MAGRSPCRRGGVTVGAVGKVAAPSEHGVRGSAARTVGEGGPSHAASVGVCVLAAGPPCRQRKMSPHSHTSRTLLHGSATPDLGAHQLMHLDPRQTTQFPQGGTLCRLFPKGTWCVAEGQHTARS